MVTRGNRYVVLTQPKVNGWPTEVVSVSARSFSDDTCIPKAITEEGIEELKKAWVAAVGRALKAGVDVSICRKGP
jgi:2,4-dienoyl-CoA reductase-like NADH-dependent reductase (Old Yellow Enzyme family)